MIILMTQKRFTPVIVVLVIFLVAGLFCSFFYLKGNVLKNMILTNNNPGMPNPASGNCIQKGGKLEIRTVPSGGQYGVCKFNDGTECEEWAYLRGTCKRGQYQVWEDIEDKRPNLNINFYTTGFTKDITDQSNSNSGTKNSWTEKENAKYLFLGIIIQNTNNFSSTNKETTLIIEGDINKEFTIPILNPGSYSQQIPVYIPLPPRNNILKISINADKSIMESDYYDNYVFVSLKDGIRVTEETSSAGNVGKNFDQLTCNDLKLINKISDFPNCR